MKKIDILITVSMVLIFITHSIDLFGQVADSLKLQPDASIKDCTFNKYSDMQKFFLNQERKIGKVNTRSYLHSITFDTINFPDPAPKYFRIGYDYLWGLNASNISIGVNPLKYREDGYNLFLSGRVGFGSSASKLILKTDTSNAKINNMFGIEAEVETKEYLLNNLKFFGGIGFSFLKPEKFEGEDNSGTVIDPFLGARYYLVPKNMNLKIGLHAKVGFIYSNGIKHLDDKAPSIYYGIGANIVSSQSFTKKGNVSWMNFESGLFISPASGVLYGQFTQPVRVMRNLSVSLNGHIGSGLYESVYNKLRVNTYWGIGADLRFFGFENGQLLKPYLGFMLQDYGYQLADTTFNSNYLTFFRIGSKVQLGRNSNWCFDVNAGVPLGTKDPFIDKDAYIVVKAPVVFEVNLGIVYKLRLFEEKKAENYCGVIEFYNDSILLDPVKKELLGEEKTNPLPLDAYADQLIEKKIYITADRVTIKPVDQIVPVIEIHGETKEPREKQPAIDVTDIRLLRLNYSKQMLLSWISHDELYKDMKNKASDTMVLLVAMFDKERCKTNVIGNNNMYLVFNDLNRSRYFGFTYDINKRLQPEQRDEDSLDIMGQPPYYGNYAEYVRKLHWMDDATASSSIVSAIENEIFDQFQEINENLIEQCALDSVSPYPVTKENFRFAYAIYPQSTFRDIKQACKNFGVSIMFRYDLNNSNIAEDPVWGLQYSEKQGLIIDKNDAAYFSNLIHATEIYSPCMGQDLIIDDFQLGKDNLTKEHISRLTEVKQYDCSIIEVAGFTDKVEFIENEEFMNSLKNMRRDPIVNECPSLRITLEDILQDWQTLSSTDDNLALADTICQRGLAWKRIRSTLIELRKYTFDISDISTQPVGIAPDTYWKEGDPRSRKVVIRFAN